MYYIECRLMLFTWRGAVEQEPLLGKASSPHHNSAPPLVLDPQLPSTSEQFSNNIQCPK